MATATRRIRRPSSLNRFSSKCSYSYWTILNFYLICLLKGVEQGLQPSKMAHEFENPQEPKHPHQPNNFPSFSNYLEVYESFKKHCQIEWCNGNEVNHVHWGFHEFYLERAAYYSYGIFEGEEDDSESIDVLNDYANDGKLLKFFNCGDDKGDRGDDDHEEGEEGNKLSNFV